MCVKSWGRIAKGLLGSELLCGFQIMIVLEEGGITQGHFPHKPRAVTMKL